MLHFERTSPFMQTRNGFFNCKFSCEASPASVVLCVLSLCAVVSSGLAAAGHSSMRQPRQRKTRTSLALTSL